MKTTTKLVLSAVILSGACTTSEPIDLTPNVPILSPADAATAGGGQAGAMSQQGSAGVRDQGGSSGVIASFGGMGGGGAAGNLSMGLPDAGAADKQAAAMPAADLAVIKAWIMAGALNN